MTASPTFFYAPRKRSGSVSSVNSSVCDLMPIDYSPQMRPVLSKKFLKIGETGETFGKLKIG